MSLGAQEIVAFAIVAAAFAALGWSFYRKNVAPPLSQWLLRQGKVKLAMRVRGHAQGRKRAASGGAGSHDCH